MKEFHAIFGHAARILVTGARVIDDFTVPALTWVWGMNSEQKIEKRTWDLVHYIAFVANKNNWCSDLRFYLKSTSVWKHTARNVLNSMAFHECYILSITPATRNSTRLLHHYERSSARVSKTSVAYINRSKQLTYFPKPSFFPFAIKLFSVAELQKKCIKSAFSIDLTLYWAATADAVMVIGRRERQYFIKINPLVTCTYVRTYGLCDINKTVITVATVGCYYSGYRSVHLHINTEQ